MTTPLPTEIDTSAGKRIAIITLEQGDRPVIVLNHELIQRIDATIDALPTEAQGMVLRSGSAKVFVAGADLSAIQDLSDDRLTSYLQYGGSVYGKIARLPYPTAAAINGAALGGGLELAMHCDGLIGCPGAKPYPIGLPEAGLSICPGWGGTQLLPARMDPAAAIRATCEGKPLMYDDAVAAGLFDGTAADSEALIPAALAWVAAQPEPGANGRDGAPSRWIGRGDRAAAVLDAAATVRGDLGSDGPAGAVLDAVDAGLSGGWQAGCASEVGSLVRLRSTAEGKAAITAFFAKSKK